MGTPEKELDMPYNREKGGLIITTRTGKRGGLIITTRAGKRGGLIMTTRAGKRGLCEKRWTTRKGAYYNWEKGGGLVITTRPGKRGLVEKRWSTRKGACGMTRNQRQLTHLD